MIASPLSSESSSKVVTVDRRALVRRAGCSDTASPAARAFYVRVMTALGAASLEYLVGGTYAFTPYTGIARSTKDFDIFVRRDDADRALEALADSGLRVEMTFPHWLAKAFHRRNFVDIIFNSGNSVAPVDEEWFIHGAPAVVLGVNVKLVPAEEMLWSKAFVMERERYDGADIVHIIRSRAERLDWDRILARFGERWRVLLFNLILFGFVYPSERARVPARVMRTLIDKLNAELDADAPSGRLCQGTLVSREQYLADTHEWGYADARELPFGGMTPAQLSEWTAAIGR